MPIEEVYVNPTAKFLRTHTFSSISVDEGGNVLATLASQEDADMQKAIFRELQRQAAQLKELLSKASHEPVYLETDKLVEENADLRVKTAEARQLCEWYREWWMFMSGRGENPGEFPFSAVHVEPGEWSPWSSQDNREDARRSSSTTEGYNVRHEPTQSQGTALESNDACA